MSWAETVVSVSRASIIFLVARVVKGVTVIPLALLMDSVIPKMDNVSASLVLLVSSVTVVNLIILVLLGMDANPVIVIVKVQDHYNARMMENVTVRTDLWVPIVISVKKIISTIAQDLAARSALPATDW